jgi:hypothetical protein
MSLAPATPFHFAPFKSSHGPITAQWTAAAPKPTKSKLVGHTQAPDTMYATQQYPSNHPSQPGQPQQPFPSAQASSHGHERGRSGTLHPPEDDYERQLDYETDANTSYNAALLSANARSAPLPPQGRDKSRDKDRDKGKGKTRERGKESASKARRRAIADQARRERRRADGLESDTTQGQDTDSDEYVTGLGSSTKPPNGMFGGQGAW